MHDDELLQRLAEIAREEEEEERRRVDPRWDELSAGTLPPGDEKELRVLAAGSDEAKEAYEAFRPLGADFRARLLRAAAPRIGEPEPRSGEPESARRDRRFSFSRRRTRKIVGWLAAAAAAAVLLWVGRPATPPLPEYVAELEPGLRAERSAGEEAAESFCEGSRFELVLRPRDAVSGEIEGRFFLERDGRLRRWEPDVERSEGSLRIAGEVGREIRIEPGKWTLCWIVGRPRRLPDGATPCSDPAIDKARDQDWVLEKLSFEILEVC